MKVLPPSISIKQDRRQHSVGLWSTPHAGQKLLDLVDDAVHVACEQHVVLAWKLHQLGRGDVLSQITGVVKARNLVLAAAENKRWHPNRRQECPQIGLKGHARVGQRRSWTHR
jgi:hypothetical protein